jgi:hypothetical protein
MPKAIGIRGDKVIGSDNVGIQARRRVVECREDVHDVASQEARGAGDENIAAGQLAEHVGNSRVHHFGVFVNDFARSIHVQCPLIRNDRLRGRAHLRRRPDIGNSPAISDCCRPEV